MKRLAVGIDLGTTHSAMAWADPSIEGARTDIVPIEQLVGPAMIGTSPLLPSFLYFAHEGEAPLALPWDKKRSWTVGDHARKRGPDAPGRVVSSAKSWLCHGQLDPRSAILPTQAAGDMSKISPVEASSRILQHLSEAFEQAKKVALGEQDIVLTVPASFDPSARDLTVEAARSRGLQHLTLLEEPQAALYAWLEAAGEGWRKKLQVGDVILVVDVGGGTTDFSAIVVKESGGSLELERLAVGDHILLGGDNMDLALAHQAASKLGRTDLVARELAALGFTCRAAKERLLEDNSVSAVPVTLVRPGSQLVGGTLRTELTRDEVEALIVQGFFPRVEANSAPAVRARSALTQLGLPYAADAAITRHLAGFLRKHAALDPNAKKGASDGLLCPTAILLNGGVLKSQRLAGELLGTISDWTKALGRPAPRLLESRDLDLAVARGASYFGLVRQGRGVRIRGGTARSYYVGIEAAMPAVPGMAPPTVALCVAPFGMEEGTKVEPAHEELGVVVGEPVRFKFFGSTSRRKDAPGHVLEKWPIGELEELAPIEVTLATGKKGGKQARKAGDVVPVRLHASVSDVGTLDLRAVPTSPAYPDEFWNVELSVRESPADG